MCDKRRPPPAKAAHIRAKIDLKFYIWNKVSLSEICVLPWFKGALFHATFWLEYLKRSGHLETAALCFTLSWRHGEFLYGYFTGFGTNHSYAMPPVLTIHIGYHGAGCAKCNFLFAGKLPMHTRQTGSILSHKCLMIHWGLPRVRDNNQDECAAWKRVYWEGTNGILLHYKSRTR